MANIPEENKVFLIDVSEGALCLLVLQLRLLLLVELLQELVVDDL